MGCGQARKSGRHGNRRPDVGIEQTHGRCSALPVRATAVAPVMAHAPVAAAVPVMTHAPVAATSPEIAHAPAAPLIGFGEVRHARIRPRRNAFAYTTFFLMLPMRSMRVAPGALATNRRAAIGFHDSDHGDGRSFNQGGALAWLEELLRNEGIDDATGEVWLQCYPRVFGYTFKPVSFWYCHRADGSLRAIVVEVNNTFGDRHCYLLDEPQYGVQAQAHKVFHVSPFCELDGVYRFHFLRTRRTDGEHVVARIDYEDDAGPLLQTSVSGRLEPVTPASLRRALWRYPLMTLMVIVRIHWQALKLWAKRTRLHARPDVPARFVTR